MELIHVYLVHTFQKKAIPWPENLKFENRYKNYFWITKDFQMVYPYDLSDDHLLAILNLIARKPELKRRFVILKELISEFDHLLLHGPYNLFSHKSAFQSKKSYSKTKQFKREQKFYHHYNLLWREYLTIMLLVREAHCRGLNDPLIQFIEGGGKF